MWHAAPRMPQGSIIITSGSLSSRPRLGAAMLTAMLSAVEALAPALALELAPLRVNAVTPGLTDTPLLHTAYRAERDTLVKNRAAILPGRRVGTADEVAQVILMLMTNDYLADEVVHVDGGGRFVSHHSSDSVYDRWSDGVQTAAGDVHPSAMSAGRGHLPLAGHPAAGEGAPGPRGSLCNRSRGS